MHYTCKLPRILCRFPICNEIEFPNTKQTQFLTYAIYANMLIKCGFAISYSDWCYMNLTWQIWSSGGSTYEESPHHIANWYLDPQILQVVQLYQILPPLSQLCYWPSHKGRGSVSCQQNRSLWLIILVPLYKTDPFTGPMKGACIYCTKLVPTW